MSTSENRKSTDVKQRSTAHQESAGRKKTTAGTTGADAVRKRAPGPERPRSAQERDASSGTAKSGSTEKRRPPSSAGQAGRTGASGNRTSRSAAARKRRAARRRRAIILRILLALGLILLILILFFAVRSCTGGKKDEKNADVSETLQKTEDSSSEKSAEEAGQDADSEDASQADVLDDGSSGNEGSEGESSGDDASEGENPDEASAEAEAEPAIPEDLPDIDVSDWKYLLANPWNSVEDYTPSVAAIEGIQLDYRVVADMQKFVADCRAQGLSVVLASGYRDFGTQTFLFNRKVAQYGGDEATAATIVARPGTSEHQTGLCADITDQVYEYKNESLENTAMYQWMSQHCQEYGFIVRFPKGKEDITGIIYEPWHFRYVGVEAATYIMEHNLTLEEFLSYYEEIKGPETTTEEEAAA